MNDSEEAKKPFFERMEARIHHVAAWPGVPFILFAIAFIDFIISFLPADGFLIAAILGYRKRTILFCLSAMAGKMAALAALGVATQYIPIEQIYAYFQDSSAAFAWEQGQKFFERFGALSLSIVTVTPLPMQVVALLSFMANVTLLELELYFLVGLLVRYIMLVYLLKAGVHLYKMDKKAE